MGVRERPKGKTKSQCLRLPSLFCHLCVFIPTLLYSNLVMIFRSCFKKKKSWSFEFGGIFFVWFWGHHYHYFWISGFSDILDFEINLFLATLHFFRDSPFSWSYCVNSSCFPQATYELDLIFNQSFQLHFMRKAGSSHMVIGISTIKSRGNNWLKEKEIDNWGLFLFSLRGAIGTRCCCC